MIKDLGLMSIYSSWIWSFKTNG